MLDEWKREEYIACLELLIALSRFYMEAAFDYVEYFDFIMKMIEI